MRRSLLAMGGALPLLLGGTGAAWAREPLGAYRGWAAFRDDDPVRCYAQSAPASAPEAGPRGAFAAVGYRPERRASGQVHVRFARPVRAGSAILLSVDDQLFQLRGRGADAWAGNAAADRAIVAAMRTGVRMAASTRDADGRPVVDRYALGGAASAIDAAAIACRRGADD